MTGADSRGFRGVIRCSYFTATAAAMVLAAVGPASGVLAASTLRTELLPIPSSESPSPNLGVRGEAECSPGELRVRLDRVVLAENPVVAGLVMRRNSPAPSEPAESVEIVVFSLFMDGATRGELRVRGEDVPACTAGDQVIVLDSSQQLLLVGVLR
jgi:hypothetical protein